MLDLRDINKLQIETRWQKEKFKGIAQVRKKFEAMDISMLLAFVDRETVIR